MYFLKIGFTCYAWGLVLGPWVTSTALPRAAKGKSVTVVRLVGEEEVQLLHAQSAHHSTYMGPLANGGPTAGQRW